ncbi:hypothetical protein BDF21DRAFT_455260 [Thamnidium elegans]|nr:hypothetical protein BDF21DRAFT_455260 [Thamnidium elegans]
MFVQTDTVHLRVTAIYKERKRPIELNWLLKNQQQLNHLIFFDFFQAYNRQTVTRRSEFIVEYCFINSKESKLINDFENWRKTKEAKLYWERRKTRRIAGLANTITFGAWNEHIYTCSSNVISSVANTVPATGTTLSDTSTLVSEDTGVMSTTEANTLFSASFTPTRGK